MAAADGPQSYTASTLAGRRNLRQAACSVGLDPSYWYPVEYDSALKRETVISVKFQNMPVAVYRGRDGTVRAIEDRCPHRHVKLSRGFVEDCNLRCFYHGWTFSPDGRLCKIEHELFGKPFPSVKLRTFPVQIRYGLIWVFFGDSALKDKRHIPEIPELEPDQPWVYIPKTMVLKAHPTMIVNNFMDSTHVATLHNRQFKTRAFTTGDFIECDAPEERVIVGHKVEIDKTGLLRHTGPAFQDNVLRTCYEYPYLWADLARAYKLWTLMLPLDQHTTKVFLINLTNRVKIPFTPCFAPKWMQRFVTRFGARFVIDPLHDADGWSAEMEQEGMEENPGLAPIDPHPAPNLCYQLTIRKWAEHLARD